VVQHVKTPVWVFLDSMGWKRRVKHSLVSGEVGLLSESCSKQVKLPLKGSCCLPQLQRAEHKVIVVEAGEGQASCGLITGGQVSL